MAVAVVLSDAALQFFFCSILLYSLLLHPFPLCSIVLDSMLLHSIIFSSHSILFDSILPLRWNDSVLVRDYMTGGDAAPLVTHSEGTWAGCR